MSAIINYAKKDYEAKITELESYNKLLEGHLTKMETYKSQIKEFWEDDNAETTIEILQAVIVRTKRTMSQVDDNLIFYRNIVTKMGGVGSATDDLLKTALGAIGAL